MKKTILIVFSLLITLFIFCACNEKSNELDTQIFPYLRLGFQANTNSIEYLAASKFAEKVTEFSNGTIDIEIYPNGQLGDDIKMLDAVSAGTFDIAYAETGRLGLWVKEAEIFGYPFAFDDFDHLKRTLESEYGQELQKKFLKHGFRILATGYNGSRQTTSNKPINSIKDMEGMKLRVPNSNINLKFAKFTKTIPIIMPFKEVYPALKTKYIDGQENPLQAIKSEKFYEVQKYCAITNHIINDCNFVISESTYQLLSEDQKFAVTEAAKIATDYQTLLAKTAEKKLIELLTNQGMIFTYPDRAPFKEACKPMFENYKSKYGTDAIDAIESTRL